MASSPDREGLYDKLHLRSFIEYTGSTEGDAVIPFFL